MTTSVNAVVGDRYRLVDQIGAGGMGRVWRARDEKLNRVVAVKEIVPPAGVTEAERQRLERRSIREARAIARLNNEHVVRVYDVVDSAAGPLIVMEYVPSRSLQQVLDVDGPITAGRAAQIGLAVLDGLTAAHAAGVLHRDIKPGNILLADDGRVVLTDFGVATVAGEATVTQSGPMFLSPAFVAPERARHGADSTASDLWSLGATLFAAVQGHPPFARPSAMESLAALISDPVPAAPRAGELRPVLDGLLHKDPAQRIDAATARKMLQRAAATTMAPTTPPTTPPTRSPAATIKEPAATPARGRAPARPVEPTRVAVPPVIPESPGPGRRSRVAVVALAVALLVGGTIWLVSNRSAEHVADQTTPSAATSQAAPQTTSATTPVAPVPSLPAASGISLPPGWRIYHDPSGFSVAVPISWRFSRDGTIIYFRENGGQRRILGFDRSSHPKADPVADWTNQESVRLAAGDWKNYQRIAIVAVDYFEAAADWDYLYDGANGRVRVRNRGFVTSPTQAYAIYWSTPANRWDENLPLFNMVAASFRPAT